jgi:DNA mismatch endonuclease (patch repair protein)
VEGAVDSLTPQQRSANMARIRGRDTEAEQIVRRLAHSLGYRFRLHRRDLPGTPDLVFPALRQVIFVHGCFWHRHPGCKYSYSPKSNVNFWRAKFAANTVRDARVEGELKQIGWSVLTIWECETTRADLLAKILRGYLSNAYR